MLSLLGMSGVGLRSERGRPLNIRLKCLVAQLLMIGASGSAAFPQEQDKVDVYVKAEMQRQKIPGLALGIYRDGKIERVQGYGLADVELDVSVKPETVFQSGSVGKQFTATGIMMLVEEGKVDLDDSILKYFPDGPQIWAPVKVKNLLSHTSGIGEYENEERTKPNGPFYLRLDNTEDELYKKITQMPMDFPPGDRWRYTNTNFVLLGMMIHRVTGKFYGDFLADRIFQPLGMTATRVISEEDIIPNRSSGYRLVKGQLKNQEWVSPTFNTTADGALYFNVLDLSKWDAALYTERLLKRSSLDKMWTVVPLNNGEPNPGNYGFGWDIGQINGHRVIQHGGAWQGFTTYIARYVDDKLTIVVLTNLDSAHSNPGKIAHGVAGLLNSALTPTPASAIEDKEPQVTAMLRGVLAGFAEGKTNREQFTPKAWDEISPELGSMAEYLKEIGPLQKLELLSRTERGTDRLYTYRAIYKEAMLMRLRLTSDSKIASLGLDEEE
jgi:CubicO group peptidase (beta-lactamase class C family)